MGFSLSWIGFRDLPLDVAAEALGMAIGGGRAGLPDVGAAGLRLDGWSTVIFTPMNDRLWTSDAVSRLSAGRDIIVVHVSETVMYVSAARWRDGVKAWSVTHDSDKGSRHLEVEGAPPAALEVLRDKWFAEQDAQDANTADPFPADYIFEIPVELAELETGYRHDSSGWDMVELVSTDPAPPRKGFFQRLMSKFRLWRAAIWRAGGGRVSIALVGFARG